MSDSSPSPDGRGRSPGDAKKGKKKGKKSGEGSPSRSPSPDGGGGRARGRDREKRRSGSPRRGKVTRKVTGPQDWTREELMDRIRKFGTFKQDKSSGVGTLEALNRRLMGDDIVVIQEVLRRYTEVQHVTFSRCFLTDDTFKLICDGFAQLRRLRTLNAPFNSLSSASVARVIAIFDYKDQPRVDRRIEEIDFRNNNLNVADGQALFDAFPTIRSLNGIKVFKYRRDPSLREMDLSDMSLRITEVKILDCLLHSLVPQHVSDISLANNKLNCKSLIVLAVGVGEVGNVRKLNISNNPVTDGNLDFTGLEALVLMARTNKHLCEVVMDGITGLTPEQSDKLQRSLSVNRSLSTTSEDGMVLDLFSKFIRERMTHTVKPLPPVPLLEDMDPVFTVDYTFCRLNRIPERIVDTSGVGHGEGFQLKQKYDTRVKNKSAFA